MVEIVLENIGNNVFVEHKRTSLLIDHLHVCSYTCTLIRIEDGVMGLRLEYLYISIQFSLRICLLSVPLVLVSVFWTFFNAKLYRSLKS